MYENVTLSVEHISPQAAMSHLDRMGYNRKIDQNRVNALARDMLHGAWGETYDIVAFNRDGALLNGQHRLMAVVQSGIGQTFVVGRGFDQESYQTADRQKTRNLKDDLEFLGVPNAKDVATAARKSFTYDELGYFPDSGGPRPSPVEALAIYQADDERFQKAVRAAGRMTKAVTGRNRTSLFAAPIYILYRDGGSEDAVDEFLHELQEGAGLPGGSATLILRNILGREGGQEVRLNKVLGPKAREVAPATLFNAWNEWLEDASTTDRQIVWSLSSMARPKPGKYSGSRRSQASD